MGAQTSSVGPTIAIHAKSNPDEFKGGYRTTVANTDIATTDKVKEEDPISAAYERGKKEGMESVQQSLSIVAAQVYDNVNQQLLELQDKHATQSKELATIIERKLAPIRYEDQACLQEKLSLAQCLESNVNKSLTCSTVADIFNRCARDSISKSQ